MGWSQTGMGWRWYCSRDSGPSPCPSSLLSCSPVFVGTLAVTSLQDLALLPTLLSATMAMKAELVKGSYRMGEEKEVSSFVPWCEQFPGDGSPHATVHLFSLACAGVAGHNLLPGTPCRELAKYKHVVPGLACAAPLLSSLLLCREEPKDATL